VGRRKGRAGADECTSAQEKGKGGAGATGQRSVVWKERGLISPRLAFWMMGGRRAKGKICLVEGKARATPKGKKRSA